MSASGSNLVLSPPLAREFRVQPFYRVLGWMFFDDAAQWHACRSLHAHLACSVIRRWRKGGFERDHAKSGRSGPPMPASATKEFHVPTDVPLSLRCALCWGPLRDAAPDWVWRAGWRDALNPYTADGHWHCTPQQVTWWAFQCDAERVLWRQHHGGIYEREVIVLGSPSSTVVDPRELAA